MCPRSDDYIDPPQHPPPTIIQCDLDRPRTDEAPRPHDEFRTAFPVFLEMHLDQPRDHLSLAVAHRRHVHSEPLPRDAELPAAAHVRRHLSRMNHVLARQARNIRTQTRRHTPLNHRDSLPLLGKGPCRELCPHTGADDRPDRIAPAPGFRTPLRLSCYSC